MKKEKKKLVQTFLVRRDLWNTWDLRIFPAFFRSSDKLHKTHRKSIMQGSLSLWSCKAKFFKKTHMQVFPCEFCQIFQNTFSQKTAGWLFSAKYLLFVTSTSAIKFSPWLWGFFLMIIYKQFQSKYCKSLRTAPSGNPR